MLVIRLAYSSAYQAGSVEASDKGWRQPGAERLFRQLGGQVSARVEFASTRTTLTYTTRDDECRVSGVCSDSDTLCADNSELSVFGGVEEEYGVRVSFEVT